MAPSFLTCTYPWAFRVTYFLTTFEKTGRPTSKTANAASPARNSMTIWVFCVNWVSDWINNCPFSCVRETFLVPFVVPSRDSSGVLKLSLTNRWVCDITICTISR
mmetsp:Transcript_39145/g.61958  ORF Transcript_39145/g.61958 Transcript_39145/m.61958 type:complete len:105 (-) Transcript_39145:124-438(-)